ncbi:MAG: hypothetical protein E6G10_12940 [Actinobacteria bacterium]|nr:MAG: hypothetical protein E6G10_12940 [Actinomycetota bacterium]
MRRSLTTAAAAAILLAGCGGSDNEKPSATNAPAPKKPAPPATTPAAAPKPKPKPAPKRHAPPAKAIGIGDQGAAMFGAPLFRSLRIDKARRVVPWDVMQIRSEVQLTDAWLAAARRAGVEAFISFGASRRNPAKLPSVAQFRAAFQAFRKRYPQVRVYSPWNEVNHKSQPTADRPERAAAYYEVVRDSCRNCTVVAADVLDQQGFTRYLARFRRATSGPTPHLWGLHNYSDTNRFRTRGTRAMLRAVPGQIWVTETGGVARFGRSFPFDLRRQARATAYTFKLLKLSPRIRRLYVYNWAGAPPGARFDAGLTNADGSPRPAYRTLERELSPRG